MKIFLLEYSTNHPSLLCCLSHDRDRDLIIIKKKKENCSRTTDQICLYIDSKCSSVNSKRSVDTMSAKSALEHSLKNGPLVLNEMTYTSYAAVVVVESILVHDPIRLLAVGSSAFVEHKSLPHTDPLAVAAYDLVTAGGLPESGSRCTVCASSGRVFLVLVAEEIPIILRCRSYLTLLCKNQHQNLS